MARILPIADFRMKAFAKIRALTVTVLVAVVLCAQAAFAVTAEVEDISGRYFETVHGELQAATQSVHVAIYEIRVYPGQARIDTNRFLPQPASCQGTTPCHSRLRARHYAAPQEAHPAFALRQLRRTDRGCRDRPFDRLRDSVREETSAHESHRDRK